MDFAYWVQLLTALEANPKDVQLYHLELEVMIQECMGRVLELAKEGNRDDEKMKLVALEYRARLLLERWKKESRN